MFLIHIVRNFNNSTFEGARVHSILVAIQRRQRRKASKPVVQDAGVLDFSIIRGGLPCFKAQSDPSGLPFVHTTDIMPLVNGVPFDKRLVQPKSNSVVDGPVILLPRVGVPRDYNLEAIALKEKMQLSDCLIALQFSTMRQARQISKLLKVNKEALIQIYRGTGARYITVERLKSWLLLLDD